MWFKQTQLFKLTGASHFSTEVLTEQLSQSQFTACLPSLPASAGWVSPYLDEPDAPLFRTVNGCTLLCLQVEEKILPAGVIKQNVDEKIKKIEKTENRKVYQQERNSLKDEMTVTLLPRAFSKLTRVYGFLDSRHSWLVLGTTSTKLTEYFLSVFKKSVTDAIQPIKQQALTSFMTHWLKADSCPAPFNIERAAVLNDPANQGRVIRCQQQDLFSESIQTLLAEGCCVKQLAFSWQGQVSFNLTENFTLQSIRFEDQIMARSQEMEPETQQQQMDADFFVMTEVLSALLVDLCAVSEVAATKENEKSVEVVVEAVA